MPTTAVLPLTELVAPVGKLVIVIVPVGALQVGCAIITVGVGVEQALLIVTVKLHVDLLLLASVAVNVTVVVPTGKQNVLA